MQHFTQRNLLLEAAKTTEPENERWLLERKRLQQRFRDEGCVETESKKSKGKMLAPTTKTVVSRYHSRKGFLNTITYMDNNYSNMLKPHRKAKRKERIEKRRAVCVVTGKPGRYKDPLTGEIYADLHAFKKIRGQLHPSEQKNNATDSSETNIEKDPTGSKKKKIPLQRRRNAKKSRWSKLRIYVLVILVIKLNQSKKNHRMSSHIICHQKRKRQQGQIT